MAKTFAQLSDVIFSYPFMQHIADNNDKDYSIAIKYIGASTGGTVAVASGDWTFKQATVLDTTIDSGGDDAGVIDVSDANANSMGEVVDLINASPNWKAMLIGSLRADLSAATTLDLGTTEAKINADHSTPANYWGGIAFLRDTSADVRVSTTAKAIGLLLSKKDLDGNDNSGITNVLASAAFTWVNGGTTEVNECRIYSVNDLTGTETLIYVKALGADPAAVLIDDDDFGDMLLAVEPGNGLLVRGDADAATTSATIADGTAILMQVVGGYRKLGVSGKKWFLSDR